MTPSSPLDALIAELERANEGSLELDCLIANAVLGTRMYIFGGGVKDTNGIGQTWDASPAHYTTSLDAALTLVPSGMGYIIIQSWQRCGGTHASVTYEGPDSVGCTDKRNGDATHKSTAIAVSCAALKARARRDHG